MEWYRRQPFLHMYQPSSYKVIKIPSPLPSEHELYPFRDHPQRMLGGKSETGLTSRERGPSVATRGHHASFQILDQREHCEPEGYCPITPVN